MAVERSGIHLTGADSGWPVAQDPEPDPYKDGTGDDPHDQARQSLNGTVLDENAANEVQSVTVNAAGGTFTLTYSGQTTSALAFDISAANLKAALEALSNIGAGDVAVTGGPGDDGGTTPYVVSFQGDLAYTDVAQMTSNAGSLTGGAGTAVVATVTPGDD